MATKYEVPDKLFITPADMRLRYGRYDPNVFRRWERAGKVRKIRNGLYRTGQREIQGDYDRFVQAKHIYGPSYVSLYSALRLYNFIPEAVYRVTSITTRKTNSLRVGNTSYDYQTVKPELFFGYRTEHWKGSTFYLATPEKALLDLAYLEPDFSDREWIRGMRFDYEEMQELLDWSTMFLYADQIDSRVMKLRITLLLEEQERAGY